MNEQIRLLLHKLSKRTESSVEEEETIIANLSEISTCLATIATHFLDCENLEDTLISLPEAGQLIGRLCSSRHILGNGDLHERLMKCIFALFKEHALSPLEMKAKTWGLDKIRGMQKLEGNDLSLGFGLELDYSDLLHHYLTVAVRKITSNMSAKMKYGNEDKLSNNEISSCLVPITSFLLCSPQTELFSKIWEEIFDILRQDSGSDAALVIFEKLTDYLKWSEEHRDSRLYLDDSALLRLYRSYRPALEQEILLTIQACCQYRLKSYMSKIIESKPLHRIAVCDDSILTELVHMLQRLYFETGSDTVLQFTSTFYMCMRKFRLKDHREKEISFWIAYPSHLKSVAVCLSKFTRDKQLPDMASMKEMILPVMIIARVNSLDFVGMKLSLIEEEIRTVYTSLGNMKQTGRSTLESMMSYFLLKSFSACYYQALKILLIGDKRLMDCSLGVLCYYHGIDDEEWTQTVEQLRKMLSCLRPLITKSSLSEADLTCALSPTISAVEMDNVLHRIVSHLLLTFMFYAVDGIRLIEQIFQLVNLSKKTEDSLVILMNANEDLEIDFSTWPVDKLQVYKSYISSLIDRTEQTEHNSKVVSAGSSFVKFRFHCL